MSIQKPRVSPAAPFTAENLQNFRAIVESGTPLARNTVLRLIENARAHLVAALPQVSTVEELDQLSVGTVVLSTAYVAKQEGHEYPCAFQKLYTGEWHRGGRLSDTHPDYFLPARVLHRPEVDE